DRLNSANRLALLTLGNCRSTEKRTSDQLDFRRHLLCPLLAAVHREVDIPLLFLASAQRSATVVLLLNVTRYLLALRATPKGNYVLLLRREKLSGRVRQGLRPQWRHC